jgi:hypothetical protein
MMDNFFSMWNPGGFFTAGEMNSSEKALASSLMLVEESGRKRARDTSSGSRTPTLISSTSSRRLTLAEDEGERPIKRFRGKTCVIPISPVALHKKKEVVSPLSKVPEDVVAHCLSFLGDASDRFPLQCTSKQFKRISNTPEMLSKIEVGGDKSTGLHGIIQEDDTPETATLALKPFSDAGNLEAIYM